MDFVKRGDFKFFIVFFYFDIDMIVKCLEVEDWFVFFSFNKFGDNGLFVFC